MNSASLVPLSLISSAIFSRQQIAAEMYSQHRITATDSHSMPEGGPLVFKGGYHARVWPLKTDPKQGF